MVAHRESATLAERFIRETCARQGIGREQRRAVRALDGHGRGDASAPRNGAQVRRGRACAAASGTPICGAYDGKRVICGRRLERPWTEIAQVAQYHDAGDTPDRLDFGALGRVVDGLSRAVVALAGEDSSDP